jgi:hypothetical protein
MGEFVVDLLLGAACAVALSVSVYSATISALIWWALR